MLSATAAHVLQLPLQSVDTVADKAAVSFQLRFAGASCPNTAAKSLKVTPLAANAWQEVFMLRQFNLQPPLHGLGPLREDVQNQRRSIQNLDLERFFEIALLGWRQLVIEDDGGYLFITGETKHLFEFAAAHVVRGESIESLALNGHNSCAGALRKGIELFKGLIE